MFTSLFTADSAGAGSLPLIERNWETFEDDYFGFATRIPYIRITGMRGGPGDQKGIIIAGIHGDELNGIRIIHELADLLSGIPFSGQLLLVPIANIGGFFLQSRYLSDRRDLNRMFPGGEDGSEGSRLAHFIWQKFIEGADYGIDLHSASYNRWNFPHIRGNMRHDGVRMLARAFAAPVTIHSKGVQGSLRREATLREIPFLLFEAGQSNRFEDDLAGIGLSGIFSVLEFTGQITHWPEKIRRTERKSGYYKKSTWLRAENGGLFVPKALPGDRVNAGALLGHIFSALGEPVADLINPVSGRVLGFNLHPQVVPGRALYHICTEKKSFKEAAE